MLIYHFIFIVFLLFFFLFFFFNDTPTTEIYTLSLHDALPIFLSSNYDKLSPIEIKILYLKLLLEKELTKRLLLIIELPEIYAEEQELKEFVTVLEQLICRGCNAIIITTSDEIVGRNNFILNNQVINEARIDLLRSKLISTVPIPIDEQEFLKAKDLLLSSVDKWDSKWDHALNLNVIH